MINICKINLIGLLILLISFSCTKEDPIAVTASAGADQTISFGEAVTFNGSGTSSTGGVLTYVWETITLPANSNLGKATSFTQDFTFTPDVEGDYVVRLTVANETSTSSTDEAVVTVASPEFVIIETDITTPTLLKNLSDGVDYLVKGFLNVNAALTVEPGVRIHFDENAGFSIKSAGSINAVGIVSDSIIFTGATEVEGFWRGLLFVDSDNNINELTYCRVSYAGSSNLTSEVGKANIGIGYFLNPSRLKLKNSLVRNADGRGISFDYRANARFPMFANNKIANNNGLAMRINVVTAGDLDANTVFSNNDANAVEVYSASSEKVLDEDAAWVALNNVPYQIQANIKVKANLQINAGAILEFGSDKYMRIEGDGSLLAIGTSSSIITFTGISKTKGFWRGVYFEDSNNVINELTYVIFEYGGSSNLTSQLLKSNLGIGYFLNPSKLKITNVVSRESGGTGFAIDYRSNGELTTFSNNNFSNNADYGLQITPFQLQYLDEASTYSDTNGNSDILVSYAGTNTEMNTDATWITPADGSKYIMDCNVIYNNNLVINPGAVFEFTADKGFRIDGSLSAAGTSSKHIVFSAVTKSAGAWKGVRFWESNNVNNKLHYVDISYGGSSTFNVAKANLNVDRFIGGSMVSIENSSFTNSAGYGIAISLSSSITASNNSFSGNALADIFQE